MRWQRRSGSDRGNARLVAAGWVEMSEQERQAALVVAREEGRRAAQGALADLAAEIAGREDSRYRLYAHAWSMACEHFYIERVVEPCCPERASWWWGSEIAERRADPRVCVFCDAYERERRRVLGLTQPPTGIAGLQIFLAEAREREECVSLLPGTLLLLYTDGVTDPWARHGEWETTPLQRLLMAHGERSAEEISREIMAAMRAEAGGFRGDDASLIVIRGR